jgi:hypothetical protein
MVNTFLRDDATFVTPGGGGGGGGLIIATSDVTFYVNANTGNDANDGLTVGTPFLTIQHAINTTLTYDWANLWKPIIHLADGHYTEFQVNITQALGLIFAMQIIGNLGAPGNVIVDAQFQMEGPGPGVAAGFGGINFACTVPGFGAIDLVSAFVFLLGDIIYSGTGPGSLFFLEGYSFLFCGTGHTITVTSPTIQWFVFCGPGQAVFHNSTIHLPVALTVTNSFAEVFGISGNSNPGTSSLSITGTTWTNFVGVTGTNINAGNGALFQSDNNLFTDIPGSVQGTTDGTVIVGGGSEVGITFRTKAGLPAVADIPRGCWSVMKDTSGGGLYLAGNDAGVLKKVALV